MPAIDSGRVFSGGPRSLSGSRSAFHCPQPESSEAAQSPKLGSFLLLFFFSNRLMNSKHFSLPLLIHRLDCEPTAGQAIGSVPWSGNGTCGQEDGILTEVGIHDLDSERRSDGDAGRNGNTGKTTAGNCCPRHQD